MLTACLYFLYSWQKEEARNPGELKGWSVQMPDLQLLARPVARGWHLLRLDDPQGEAVQGVLRPLRRTRSREPQLTTGTRGERSATQASSRRGLGRGSSWAKVSVHSYYLRLQTLSWNETPERGPLFQRLFFRSSCWFGGVIWMCCSPGWQEVLGWASPVEIAGQSTDGIATGAKAFKWGNESRPRRALNLNASRPSSLYCTKRFLLQPVLSQTPDFIVGVKDRSESSTLKSTFLRFGRWGVTGWAEDLRTAWRFGHAVPVQAMLRRLQCWYTYPRGESRVLEG